MLEKIYKTLWGKLLIFFVFLFLVLVVAFVFYIINLSRQYSKMGPQGASYSELIKNEKHGNIPIGSNYWIGSSNPRITIIEFSDFACPYCKNSFPNIREIGIKYKGEVKIVYKDLPLHKESALLALGARCAGEQGLFWPMHDKLFANQGVTTLAQLEELAKQIGADEARFADCMKKTKYLGEIENDFATARELQLKGTPAWFINGYKIEGDIPYADFIEIIEEMVK